MPRGRLLIPDSESRRSLHAEDTGWPKTVAIRIQSGTQNQRNCPILLIILPARSGACPAIASEGRMRMLRPRRTCVSNSHLELCRSSHSRAEVRRTSGFLNGGQRDGTTLACLPW